MWVSPRIQSEEGVVYIDDARVAIGAEEPHFVQHRLILRFLRHKLLLDGESERLAVAIQEKHTIIIRRKAYSTSFSWHDNVNRRLQAYECEVTHSLLSSTFFTSDTSPKAPRPRKRTFSYSSCTLTVGGALSNGAR